MTPHLIWNKKTHDAHRKSVRIREWPGFPGMCLCNRYRHPFSAQKKSRADHRLCSSRIEGVMTCFGCRVRSRRDAVQGAPRRAGWSPAQAEQRRNAPFWSEPSGQPRKPAACGVAGGRLVLLAVAPLRRVAAPCTRPVSGAARHPKQVITPSRRLMEAAAGIPAHGRIPSILSRRNS
jgi:hypothetical protein